ncbi:DNA/RNA polymerases superfamily protein [Tanacetum coccineum]
MSKVLHERGSGSLPSSTKTNPRDHVKSISTCKEADLSSICHIGPNRYTVSNQQKGDMMALIKDNRVTIPFPGHLKGYGYDVMDVSKDLEKLQVGLTESITRLRRLIKEKSRIEEEINATVNLQCSTILDDALPPKEKRPRHVMPYSTYTNLGVGALAPTKLIVELADRTVKRPKGIVENMLVGIDKFVFPVDFIVLDMPEDTKVPLILWKTIIVYRR